MENKKYFFGNTEIAKFTHEANRLLCMSIGDNSQDIWEQAPEWQKESARQGVLNIINGVVTTPEQSHEQWMDLKLKEGWVYGLVKDPEHKTHPCLVSFDELPIEQQTKDKLFFAIVTALTKN